MKFKSDNNSFYEDLLELINKHILPDNIKQNKKFFKIRTKNYNIGIYIRQKFPKQNLEKEIKRNNQIEKVKSSFKYNKQNKNSEENFEEENYEIVNKKPKGLVNLGLNCYMNSLLQCLFYIKELREHFIENKDKFNENQPVCKAFAEVMDGLKNDEKEYFVPEEFKNIIGNKNKLFDEGKPADVKDLFFNLIDLLLAELNKENENDNYNSIESVYSDLIQMFNQSKREIEYNDNIINKLFIGYYYTIYDCMQSEQKTYSFQTETFILFELEKIQQYYIKNKNNLSLDSFFAYYFRKQENSSFYCHYCKTTHIGVAYEKIYRPPKILVIILDRGHGKKFKGKIEIKKSLDLQPFIVEENYENKYSTNYELICVSSHRGTSSSKGHYTASCLTDNNKYYYFSDINVIEIIEENLFRDEPYLLFYLRKDFYKDDVTDINRRYNIYNINNENSKFKEDPKEIKDKYIYEQNNKKNLLTINNIKAIKSNNNLNNSKDFNNFSNIQKKENIQKIDKEIKLITKTINDKEYKEIEITLNRFLKNSKEEKYIIDYYCKNDNNPYVWKLIIKSQEDSQYKGKCFEFKLDFNFGYKKIVENIKIENNNYKLNFIDNKGYLSIKFNFYKNVSCYQNLLLLFKYIYNLFNDENYYKRDYCRNYQKNI